MEKYLRECVDSILCQLSSDLVQQGDLFDPTDVDGIAKAIKNIHLGRVRHEIDVFDIQSAVGSMKEIYGI